MDFGVHRKKRQHLNITPNDLIKEYAHPVSIYKLPPNGEMTLNEFETYAIERLKILRVFEFALHKGIKLYTETWKQFIYEELKQMNLKKYVKLYQSNGTETPLVAELETRKHEVIYYY